MRRAISLAGLAAALVAALLGSASALADTGWTPPKSIADEEVQFPSVAVNGSGRTMAVWYLIKEIGEDQTEYSMRAARRAPGKGFGQPRTLGPAAQPTAPNQPSAPRVAIDRRGNAAAVWLTKDGDGRFRVAAAFKPQDGGFGEPQLISDPGQSAFDPDVAFDRSGRAIVAWERFEAGLTHIQAAIKPAGEADFGDAQTLSASGLNAAFPRVGMSDGGRAIIAWLSRDPDPASFGNHFVQAVGRPKRGDFGAPQTLSDLSLDADRPRLAVSGDGEAIAAWSQNDPSDASPGKIGAAFTPRGGGFEPLEPIAGEPGLEPFIPQVGIDGRGRATVLWAEAPPQVTAGTRLIRVARLGADGEFGRFQELDRTSDPVNLLQTSLAVSARGTAVASWIQSTVSVDPVARPVNAAVRARREQLFGETDTMTPSDVSGGFPAAGAGGRIGVDLWVHSPVGDDPPTGLDASVYRGLGR